MQSREKSSYQKMVSCFFLCPDADCSRINLSMDCFICKIKLGDLVLKEHEAAAWLTKETLYSVDWLPADQGLIPQIEQRL